MRRLRLRAEGIALDAPAVLADIASSALLVRPESLP